MDESLNSFQNSNSIKSIKIIITKTKSKTEINKNENEKCCDKDVHTLIIDNGISSIFIKYCLNTLIIKKNKVNVLSAKSRKTILIEFKN